MKRFLTLCILATNSVLHAGALTLCPPHATPTDPVERWAVSFQTGSLWSIGSNASPLNYHLLPQILEIKTPAHWSIDPGPGAIFIRSRMALELAPVIDGPESYFGGVLFSPSVEWWNDSRRWAWFVSAGGGGGQGQDFNLTWFIQSGITHRPSDSLSASLGILYQHISNGGMDDVNPGIDSLGPTFGLTWSF